MILAIPLAFLILASIVLWMIICGKGNWIVKTLVVALCLYFSVFVFMGVKVLLGWPVEGNLPVRFRVFHAIVNEPDKRLGSAGSIIVWMAEIDEEFNSVKPSSWLGMFPAWFKPGDPRSIRMPYSKAVHEAMQKAMEMGRDGAEVYMDTVKGVKKKSGQNGQPSLSNDTEFVPHKLPAPKLPEKMIN